MDNVNASRRAFQDETTDGVRRERMVRDRRKVRKALVVIGGRTGGGGGGWFGERDDATKIDHRGKIANLDCHT